ncbi:hypothetical protein AMTR_s00002p00257560 [Amborella trichopoda]|uniref:Uncharacterized protein n=1 Tax=Amborella trichopoda TaxID=13333 RepID=W1P1A3_AMBTC|nr:hypothetical protein AMTR_s00002p00257560 [Amborella trichopoda]
MIVALLTEGRHPGFYLRELGICAIYSMSTSTTREGKGEPCGGKHTNSTVMNESTKALQIIRYLEGTPDGNPDLSMRKGRDSYGPSGTTTRTYEGGTSLVQRWIELRIRKVLLLLPELRLQSIEFENWNLTSIENIRKSST